MTSEKLYNYGHVVADTGGRDEHEFQTEILSRIKSLKDVFDVVRVPHMVAYDRPGEITIGVFVERDADLTQLEQSVRALAGVNYTDFEPDGLVRPPQP